MAMAASLISLSGLMAPFMHVVASVANIRHSMLGGLPQDLALDRASSANDLPPAEFSKGCL